MWRDVEPLVVGGGRAATAKAATILGIIEWELRRRRL